jgi:uncharacterized protein YndB with AHSA1/START domain
MTTTVQVKRRYAHPADKVFDAWLTPEVAARFLFATPTGTMVRAEIDARVGGAFLFVDRRDGQDVEHVGEYLEIDRPRRLVFRFSVPAFPADATTIRVEIAPTAEGCELTLTHEGVVEDYAERTQGGWTMILGALEAALG